MLSNEKGVFSVESRDYFMRTPNMFRTNLITTTQTLNPVLAINSVDFKMLSNEKGVFSVESRDYFMRTPNLMATAYFMAMVTP